MTATVTEKTTPLPLRNDTLLGVCEAIGQDFGFNPLWLRLAFIAPLFFQPMLAIGAYLLLGAVVAASRYFFPRASVAQVTEVEAQTPEAPVQEQLPIAA
jgi:phage shock protein PspC (stress-responsive transcriptional regulator)